MTKVAAKQLTGVEVHFISAVDRGAIREPFRIMKRFIKDEDTAMLDLGQGLKGLFRKTETSAPALAVVAFSPDFPQDRAVAIMKSAGLENVGEPSKTDDALLYPLGDYKDGDNIVLYQLSEDVAVGVRREDAATVIKAFKGYEYESTDFKTVMGTNAAMPMLSVAQSALTDTIYNIMANADTVEVAKADVQKAVGDFENIVDQILNTIPTTAFKLEAAVTKAGTVTKTEDTGQADDTEKKDDGKTEADPAKVEKTDGDDAGGDNGDQGKEAADKTADEPNDADGASNDKKDEPGEVQKGDGKGKKDGDEEEDPSKKKPTKKAEGEDEETGSTGDKVLAAIAAMKTELKADVASLGETVKEQGKEIKAVAKTAENTATALKKFDEDLGLGLIGGDTDEEEPGKVQKGDTDPDADDDGYISLDTAYADPFPEGRPQGRA